MYFAYGMNTNRAGMARRCPEAIELGKAFGQNMDLVFRGPADIVPKKGSTVPGVLWLISPSDEQALDRLEGFPVMYLKKRVRVVCPALTPREISVMAYAMVPGSRTVSPPSDGYLSCISEGYDNFSHGPDEKDFLFQKARDAETVAWSGF